MSYEYSIQGFGVLIDEMDADNEEIELRNYRIMNYLEEAKGSWQYAADTAFRMMVDKITTHYTAYEEKINPLYAIQLEMEMIADKAKTQLQVIKTRLLAQILPAYQAGDRDPRILNILKDLMKADIAGGSFDASEYGGLTLTDMDGGTDVS
jgi:hypothetical protein